MKFLCICFLILSLSISGCAKKRPSRVWHLPHNVVGIEHGPESGFRKLTNTLARSIESRTRFIVLTKAGKKGQFIVSAGGEIVYDHQKEKQMLSEDEMMSLLQKTFRKKEPLVPTNQGS